VVAVGMHSSEDDEFSTSNRELILKTKTSGPKSWYISDNKLVKVGVINMYKTAQN
jgi:hypothetical protein